MENNNDNKEALDIATINSNKLTAESKELLNKIVAADDVKERQDLTYLFNENQTKKTIARIDRLSALEDKLIGHFADRVEKRTDELTTKEIIDGLKVVQDIRKSQTDEVNGVTEKPLIQINQQTNSVNMGDQDGQVTFSRESRNRVENAVASLLKSISEQTSPTTDTIDLSSTDSNEEK